MLRAAALATLALGCTAQDAAGTPIVVPTPLGSVKGFTVDGIDRYARLTHLSPANTQCRARRSDRLWPPGALLPPKQLLEPAGFVHRTPRPRHSGVVRSHSVVVRSHSGVVRSHSGDARSQPQLRARSAATAARAAPG